jgi:ubiquitin-protein ligase
MTVNKRFLKEIRQLYVEQSQKELIQNDYLIYYDENDVNRVFAIIKGPYDSVYRHKFIRLNLKIPDNYPHSPPEVTFVNYDGVRIHPNMYENGKCCATILNTWGDSKFEKWTSSMGIETVLLTFHSFLDNNPYMYEPGGRDDPSYTHYVLYQSWISCLVRYLQNEKIELFTHYIHNYMLTNIDGIFNDLSIYLQTYPHAYYYTRCFEIDRYIIDYERLIQTIQNYYNYINFSEYTNSEFNEITFQDFMNREYKCCICYDTNEIVQQNDNEIVQQNDNEIYCLKSCKHSFHKECLKNHINTNNNICPMCRTEIDQDELTEIQKLNEIEQNIWITSPLTKRRVKIGSKTWLFLKTNGHI